MQNNLGGFLQTSDSEGHGIICNSETSTMVSELSMSIPLTKSDRNRLKYLLAERKRSLSFSERNVSLSAKDVTSALKRPKEVQSPSKKVTKSRFGFCGCRNRSIFDDIEVVNVVANVGDDSSLSSSRKTERSIIQQFITQPGSENDSGTTSSGSQCSSDFTIHCKRVSQAASSLTSNSSDETQQPSEEDDESCSVSTAPPSFHSIFHDVASKISSRKSQQQKKVPSTRSETNASTATKRVVAKFRGRLAECITPSIDSPLPGVKS